MWLLIIVLSDIAAVCMVHIRFCWRAVASAGVSFQSTFSFISVTRGSDGHLVVPELWSRLKCLKNYCWMGCCDIFEQMSSRNNLNLTLPSVVSHNLHQQSFESK